MSTDEIDEGFEMVHQPGSRRRREKIGLIAQPELQAFLRFGYAEGEREMNMTAPAFEWLERKPRTVRL